MKLLCISNGHGEDAIALPVLQELQRLSQPPESIVTLPIVGVGRAYTSHGFAIAGPVQTMPSGGFLNRDSRQLAGDVRGGLIKLTIGQIGAVRKWARSGGKILAVGDIVPLLFGWLSGADYAFIGTAKSEYYVRDSEGKPLASRRNSFEIKTGSYYLPWERWLMSRSRCKAVFPRDRLTAETLGQFRIPSFDLGNPMTDGVTLDRPKSANIEGDRPLIVTLLPGSRPPEAYANWEQILIAVNSLLPVFQRLPIVCLAAIAPSLDLDTLQEHLKGQGWTQIQTPNLTAIDLIRATNATYYQRNNGILAIATQAYRECMQLGDCAIAMAGTATEQFVGLGKPAFTIPGKGPQFTPAFAEDQTRLLGDSIILVPNPEAVGLEIKRVLSQPDGLQAIASNGLLRMGTPGAAKRIAECLMTVMSN
jgi:uncharacterized protein (TIGR03492 family)